MLRTCIHRGLSLVQGPGALKGLGRRRLPAVLIAAGVGLAGALLMLSGWSETGASAHYRPGGIALDRLDSALSGGTGAVDGCIAVRPAGGNFAGKPGLRHLFDILARSATARAVLRQASPRAVHVCLDEHTDLLGYYFAGSGVIGVSTDLREGAKIAFLAHELGHVLQHPTYSDNRYFPPRDLILLRRVREAAAEALATKIVWELRQAGYPAAWQEKTATPYGDIAHAFARVIGRDHSAAALQRATRAAFDRWFAEDWRLDVYDRMTLNHLERISHDKVGLVPARLSLRDGFLRGIAKLEGSNFLTQPGLGPLTLHYFAGRLSDANETRLTAITRRARGTVSLFDTQILTTP
jgi:hypothetical protein